MAYESVKDLMTAICDEVRRIKNISDLIPHQDIPELLAGAGGTVEGSYKIEVRLVKKGTDILIYDLITIYGPTGMSWSFPLPEISGYKTYEDIELISDIVSGDKVIRVEFIKTSSEGLVYIVVTDDTTGETYAICGTDTTTRNNAIGTCTDTEISIANEYEGNTVKIIGQSAFYGNTNITGVTIPNGVEMIKTNAFNSCSALENVDLPKNCTLSGSSFANCDSLKRIFIPIGTKTTSSTYGPFSSSTNNKTLETVEFENGITVIPTNLLYKCNNIKSVTIPYSVSVIENNAFNSCSALENVDLPKNCTLSGSSFANCDSLKRIFIPIGTKTTSSTYGPFSSSTNNKTLETVEFENGITVIPTNLLYKCNNIKSVTIPYSVSVIENNAFNGCPIEGTITLGGVGHPVTSIGSNAFKNSITTAIEIYVADGVTSLKNQPWGASVASVTYRSAVTGEIVSA